MTEAAKSSFVYVTYIRTTPQKLWTAITAPQFMKKYWFGMNFETDWNVGSPWKLVFPDGRVADTRGGQPPSAGCSRSRVCPGD